MKEPGKTPMRATPAFPESIRKHYSAAISGDGRVHSIQESVGRRLIREIDPDSAEGHRLLEAGRVALWSSSKRGHRPAPLGSHPGAGGASPQQPRGRSRRLPDS